ncbi:MAG: hypothetical protein ACRDPJ_09060 [Nocardioidaceae bacterium]
MTSTALFAAGDMPVEIYAVAPTPARAGRGAGQGHSSADIRSVTTTNRGVAAMTRAHVSHVMLGEGTG